MSVDSKVVSIDQDVIMLCYNFYRTVISISTRRNVTLRCLSVCVFVLFFSNAVIVKRYGFVGGPVRGRNV